jgi:hypothetical protein
MMAVSTSETSVSFYQTTLVNILEECGLQFRRHESLKSQKFGDIKEVSLIHIGWIELVHR